MKKIEPIEWLKIILASICSFVSLTAIIYFLKSVIVTVTDGQVKSDFLVGIFFITAIVVICSIIPIVLIRFLKKKIQEIQKEDTGFEKIPKKSDLSNNELLKLSSSQKLTVLSARNSLMNSRFLVGLLFVLTVLFIVVSSFKLSNLDWSSYGRYDTYGEYDNNYYDLKVGMRTPRDNRKEYRLSDFQFFIVVAFDNLIFIIPTLLMIIWLTVFTVQYLRLKALFIKFENNFIIG